MRLSELLVPDLVLLSFEAADKWQAISALASAAVSVGRVPRVAAEAVDEALLTRERSMTTGMEDGVAIPHAAVDGISDVVAVLGLTREGIPFEALDGHPAQLIVCLIIPRAQKLQNIKTLAGIAKLFSRAEVRERILECATSDQVLATIRAAEGD